MLNLSHCLLKLGRAAEAEAEASAVIAMDKRSLKGYYRRCAPRAVTLRVLDSSALAHAPRSALRTSQRLRKAQRRGSG